MLLAAVLGGAALGLGAFTFVYAKGYSYLTSDPAACANCHVMEDHYSAWLRSSHRAVATCNDCHTPPGTVRKYATKAKNGFWHSFYFTTGNYPWPLRITEGNHDIVEEACRNCHDPMTETVDHPVFLAAEDRNASRAGEPLSCTRCHARVGHWVR